MFQIIFSEISAEEMKQLPRDLQLDILSEFHWMPKDFELLDPQKFGRLEREGRLLYRYRTKEYRLYFEVRDQGIMVHRVLHKNTLKDFLFRSRLPLAEDEELQKVPEFWEMMEGKR